MSERISLQVQLAADAAELKDVSLITTGIEAGGHGLFLDEKTAEGTMKQLLGKSVKSYLRHDGAGSDRLGQEIGFFSGIYRDGAQIRAKAFQFLDSFKREAGLVADKLLELAQKVPDQLGVSLVLEYFPVWVMADGSEVRASLMEGPPPGAVRPVPSMRVVDVISADFVGRPAANPNGLFSKETAAQVDAGRVEQMANAENSQSPAPENKVAQLSQADLDAKIAELGKQHETALSAALAAKEEQHKAALAAKDKAHADAVAALEAAHVAKVEETKKAHEAALAEKDAKIAELGVFDARHLGIAPLKVARLQAEADKSLPAPAKTDAEKWQQYSELQAKDPAKAELFKSAYLARK